MGIYHPKMKKKKKTSIDKASSISDLSNSKRCLEPNHTEEEEKRQCHTNPKRNTYRDVSRDVRKLLLGLLGDP